MVSEKEVQTAKWHMHTARASLELPPLPYPTHQVLWPLLCIPKFLQHLGPPPALLPKPPLWPLGGWPALPLVGLPPALSVLKGPWALSLSCTASLGSPHLSPHLHLGTNPQSTGVCGGAVSPVPQWPAHCPYPYHTLLYAWGRGPLSCSLAGPSSRRGAAHIYYPIPSLQHLAST